MLHSMKTHNKSLWLSHIDDFRKGQVGKEIKPIYRCSNESKNSYIYFLVPNWWPSYLHERAKIASKLNPFTDASTFYGPRVTTVRKTLVGKDTKPIYS